MERDRRGPPKVGGVEVPPPPRTPEPKQQGYSSSLPPEEREPILAWLKQVLDGQKEAQRRSEERHKELSAWREDVERRLLKLETAVVKIELVDTRIQSMSDKLTAVLDSDRRQNDDILSLKQREQTKAIAAAETATAVQKAEGDIGRKLNWRTVVGVVVAAAVAALIDSIKKALNQ